MPLVILWIVYYYFIIVDREFNFYKVAKIDGMIVPYLITTKMYSTCNTDSNLAIYTLINACVLVFYVVNRETFGIFVLYNTLFAFAFAIVSIYSYNQRNQPLPEDEYEGDVETDSDEVEDLQEVEEEEDEEEEDEEEEEEEDEEEEVEEEKEEEVEEEVEEKSDTVNQMQTEDILDNCGINDGEYSETIAPSVIKNLCTFNYDYSVPNIYKKLVSTKYNTNPYLPNTPLYENDLYKVD